jgi:hypothetical protein
MWGGELMPHKVETGERALDGAEREDFVDWDGRPFIQIAGYDQMAPFLMNVVSAYDLWMYLSSYGGITAGRRNADNAILPYQTEDKLHEAHHYSGPATLISVDGPSPAGIMWEPFQELQGGGDEVSRRLLKNPIGNQVVFEENHQRLELTFAYRWAAADRLGLVRTVRVTNGGSQPRTLAILDGVQRILPWGLSHNLFAMASCLARAYTRVELDPQSRLAVFGLTSAISDDVHPREVLRANVAWCTGLPSHDVLLNSSCLTHFRRRQPLKTCLMMAGQHAGFFVHAPSVTLGPGEHKSWHVVLDCGLDHGELVALKQRLLHREGLGEEVTDAIQLAEQDLIRFVAAADGLQSTGDRKTTVHHFANVLFNSLRGGRFRSNYAVERRDFVAFVQQRNRHVARQHHAALESLPYTGQIDDLLRTLRRQADPDLIRLGYEFLPLSHSRRHGDPSRPWNQFSIQLKDSDGRVAVHYEGNWRDIFQNWEALCTGYPLFLEHVIAKFVNGSTVDGFNPYRVTSKGLEWEEHNLDDPWSNIGYWGDHQVAYLLRLLEQFRAHRPGRLTELLGDSCFVYLQVPYRVRAYGELVKNPRNSILFDTAMARRVAERVQQMGEDGKLVHAMDGSVYHVNLLEKLLVPALSKLSNFVAGAGIWMNTQRPEWNDANNALVGYGASMVTLCYLQKYLTFLAQVLDAEPAAEFSISAEVGRWLERLERAFEEHRAILQSEKISGRERRRLLDEVGHAFSDYRMSVYDQGFSGFVTLNASRVRDLCRLTTAYAEHTIRLAVRENALFDSYSIIGFSTEDEVAVRPLYEMLEGQVAAVSSGILSSEEVIELLESLYRSRMYRADQRSFMLYPVRTLPDFIDRNIVPATAAEEIPLLRELAAAEDRTLVYRDSNGVYRFAASLSREADVHVALDALRNNPRWAAHVDQRRADIVELFNRVFQHHTFTGRSGVMYGYEGIGCIYWHMVSKLMLGIQEQFYRSVDRREDLETQRRLANLYYRVRSGLGFEKTADQFGAFPTDPHSHTPLHAGAQQPGMTGQVKEEILTRLGELGVRVTEGIVRFEPRLLRKNEFLEAPATFEYVDVMGTTCEIALSVDTLAFTYCQIPIVYVLASSQPRTVTVHTTDGVTHASEGGLDATLSREVLGRTGRVKSVVVNVSVADLCQTG